MVPPRARHGGAARRGGRESMSRFSLTAAVISGSLALASAASATPISLGRTEARTDHVSFGLGGLGNGGGNFVVTGVNGGVRKAFLYWHGINNASSSAVYDNPTVS